VHLTFGSVPLDVRALEVPSCLINILSHSALEAAIGVPCQLNYIKTSTQHVLRITCPDGCSVVLPTSHSGSVGDAANYSDGRHGSDGDAGRARGPRRGGAAERDGVSVRPRGRPVAHPSSWLSDATLEEDEDEAEAPGGENKDDEDAPRDEGEGEEDADRGRRRRGKRKGYCTCPGCLWRADRRAAKLDAKCGQCYSCLHRRLNRLCRKSMCAKTNSKFRLTQGILNEPWYAPGESAYDDTGLTPAPAGSARGILPRQREGFVDETQRYYDLVNATSPARGRGAVGHAVHTPARADTALCAELRAALADGLAHLAD
jgi:hypothetical protein